MNTKHLAKLYDRLTPREHLVSILGALARGDKVEQQRLMDSAPRIALEAPHHFGLMAALTHAADFQMMILLDLAGKYWQWWGLWGWRCLQSATNNSKGKTRGKRAGGAAQAAQIRLCGQARHHAFLFLVYFDGWQKFCSDLSIDADVLLRMLPGWDTVKLVEEQLRQEACSRADVMMFLLSEAIEAHGKCCEDLEIPPVPTVEELATEWRGFLDRRQEAFPPPA